MSTGAPRRLRWLCRRGTRELDMLLAGFLERGYEDSPPAAKAAFERLLEWPDPELQACLFGQRDTGDPELDDVVARIRDTAGG